MIPPRNKYLEDIPYIGHFLILNMFPLDIGCMNLNLLLMKMFLRGMGCKQKMLSKNMFLLDKDSNWLHLILKMFLVGKGHNIPHFLLMKIALLDMEHSH